MADGQDEMLEPRMRHGAEQAAKESDEGHEGEQSAETLRVESICIRIQLEEFHGRRPVRPLNHKRSDGEQEHRNPAVDGQERPPCPRIDTERPAKEGDGISRFSVRRCLGDPLVHGVVPRVDVHPWASEAGRIRSRSSHALHRSLTVGSPHREQDPRLAGGKRSCRRARILS